MDEGISLGLVMALVEEATGADPAVIEQAVQDWLDAHPEATTTVADGSITEQKLAAAVAAKINQVSQLSDEIDGIDSDVTDLKSAIVKNGLMAKVDYTDIDGFIANRGAITISNTWKHTAPIALKKLETISFTGSSVNSGIAMIAFVTATGTVLNPVVFGIDSSVRVYEYTAIDDCYVSVSHYAAETQIEKGIKLSTIQAVYDDLNTYRGTNLFNKNDTVDGFYISSNVIYSQADFCYTKHLIKVDPNTAYATTHSGTIFINYYDEDKTYISGTTANATTFITPNDCRFMRISLVTSHKTDCFICLASVKNREYKPYIFGYAINNIPNAVQTNNVYVGADKQYQTISGALNAITDASEFNRYIINVDNGTYSETFRTKDYVDIVGADKYKTIIDYTNADDSDYTKKSTIFATSFSTLKNLTITTKGTKYPVHSDGAYGIPYRVRIENCILKHNGFTTLPSQAGTAIGIGLYEHQHVEIVNCECIASGVFGCSAIYCHNSNDAENRSGYRSIKVEHSTLSNATYGFRIEAIEENSYQDNDAWLIGIVNNGETPIRNTHVTKDSWHLYQYD